MYYSCPICFNEIKLDFNTIFNKDYCECPHCGCIYEWDYRGDLPDTCYFLVEKGNTEDYLRFENDF